MESNQLFGYGLISPDSSYSVSQPIPSVPQRLIGSLKNEIGNSPSSPFSSQFDSDSLTTPSDSQDQYTYAENLSGISPSRNSPLEANNQFSHVSQSCQYSFPQDSYRPNINYTFEEVEASLMDKIEFCVDSVGEERTNPLILQASRPPAETHHISRSWIQEPQGLGVFQAQPVSTARSKRQAEDTLSVKRHKSMEEVSFLQTMQIAHPKQLLIACAKALSENNMVDFDKLIEKARSVVSINGTPFQRLGAYMVEGLVARKETSGTNIYRALRCGEPDGKDLLTYMHTLYEICPYFKFGYMAANGAIAEACRNEDYIHIIDFQIAQGSQWITLLQALAARPGGAPHVRITGIDDPVSKYARGDTLEAVGRKLDAISKKFNISVEFHPVPVFAPDVRKEMLKVRPGEAVAVNFPLQLHHTPDESVDVNNPRDGLLRMIRSLNPKVTTLVEQESNTNTTPFFNRFLETMDYYSAIFESLDVTMQRDKRERINVEQHCLARDIVNIIACEGKERVERHELFGKWKSRFTMAGFQQCPLSPYVNSVIKTLLGYYSEHYTLAEKDGAMLLGWKNRNLISASAWH